MSGNESGGAVPDSGTQGPEAAEHFARYVAPTYVTLARRAVDLAEIEAGNSVLDVGTTTGLAAFLAAERAGREGSIVGIDPSEAMLAIARERSTAVGYGYISWQQSDASQLTFADESFDAVLCIHALMTMARPHHALEEMRRVLVEYGRLVITTWGSREANEWYGVLERALRRVAPSIERPRAYAFSQPGNLEATLQSLGFVEIEVARMSDRMHLQGDDAFWEWASAAGQWDRVIRDLPAEARERMREAVREAVAPRMKDGEVAIGRQVVYARALAPESD
jgi:ubiquinone/menaquinone biosynthesis C-methylase UbiE